MKKVILGMLLLSSLTYSKTASWYSNGFEGKLTASGYVYNSNQLTCASNEHKFGTVLRVTNLENKKYVDVVVTDRGSFDRKYGRSIDLSKRAFSEIENIHKGLVDVSIEVLDTSKTFRYKHGSPVFKEEDFI